MNKPIFLDCTLRDGGYYNSWDFSHELVQNYIFAVKSAGVNVIELGFRTLNKEGFKGACAYTTDSFIETLELPEGIELGVMINASEMFDKGNLCEKKINSLFPQHAKSSKLSLIRIASHTYECIEALKAVKLLKEKGFKIGFNLMQVSECKFNEIELLAKEISLHEVDVLYFADSLGNMDIEKVLNVIDSLRLFWKGELGIHTHDNMGMALSNSLFALNNGITWVDSTVLGMGRGAGNAKTELLAIEISELKDNKIDLSPLISLIAKEFNPLKEKYRWGTNPFYYLSGKQSVHPSYVQEMMVDSRFKDGDIISVIAQLGHKGGKKYSKSALIEAQNYYPEKPQGIWSPATVFQNKELILLGSGPELKHHKKAIESYIQKSKALVIALNSLSVIDNKLIDYRIACHPLRLLTEFDKLNKFSQPLITPASFLPKSIRKTMSSIKLLDYGMAVQDIGHIYEKTHCILPSSLVLGYALAAASSGNARCLLLAGFDGYSSEDPRRLENENIFQNHKNVSSAAPILAITPTLYNIDSTSIYAL